MSMTCHQVSQQLIAYIKGELPKEESEQIAAHLTTCPQCRADAQALDTAFGILPQLPSAPLTYDLTAIEAATRHSSLSFTPWWRHIAAVAGTAVLLVGGFLAIHRFSSSPMPRTMLSSRPPSPLNVAAQPTPSSTGAVAHTPKLRMATASKGPSRGTREIPVVIHRQPSSPIHKTQTVTVSRQPATTQTTKSATHLTWEEPAGTPDGHTIIAQYVDTMAMCVTQSNHPRETISCAILPVTTPDDQDLHIADTLTAALVCAFQDRQVNIDLHRLPPSMPTAEQPSAATLAQLAQTVSDKYVITGSLERSETGYLLSLYAYDRQTAQLVFDGAHPILLPPDVLPTVDHADSVGS